LVVYKEVNWKIRNNVSQGQVIKKAIIDDDCFTRKEYIHKLLPKGVVTSRSGYCGTPFTAWNTPFGPPRCAGGM
jgi:hypothetical protein